MGKTADFGRTPPEGKTLSTETKLVAFTIIDTTKKYKK